MLDRRTNNHNPIAREWNEHLITSSLELNVNADALRELELVSYARSTRYTVMSDAVVMGDSKSSDSLAGITRFSGNDGKIVWPAWKLELYDRIKFEFGAIGIEILEGRLTEDMIKEGDDVDRVLPLLDAVMPNSRAQVVFKADWMIKQKAKDPEDRRIVLSLVGQLKLKSAISRVKTSYFMSIERHGLEPKSKIAEDFTKLKRKYVHDTLTRWIQKMDSLYGVNHSELRGAYIEQLTALRVIKVVETASILRNLLNQDTGWIL